VSAWAFGAAVGPASFASAAGPVTVTASLGDGALGAAYSGGSISASGGSGTYSSKSQACRRVSRKGTTFVGTPTTAGDDTVCVTAVDTSKPTESDSISPEFDVFGECPR
jgi:hypothetical protein